MFRYERPQKGRLRQFHQIGVELLGVAEPLGDVEVIALGAQILGRLGVLGRTKLELNSLGSTASRRAYREVLVEYFGDHRDSLSEDSRTRLERNPLRILDSKDERDRRVIEGAPSFSESLDQESRDFFAAVKAGLEALGIDYVENPRLVRGLDYYCHTAFEFTTDALGAQGAVMAGGRYDGLVGIMGGPETPGVGWAAGMERLAMLIEGVPEPVRPIAVVPVGAEAERAAFTLTNELRRDGFRVDIGYRGNMSRRLKHANRINARAAVILGGDELAKGAATVRDLDTGEQEQVPLVALRDRLAGLR